jgi:hypothetical protein
MSAKEKQNNGFVFKGNPTFIESKLIAGDNKETHYASGASAAEISALLQPLLMHLSAEQEANRPMAEEKLREIAEEATKGANADDGVMKTLIDGFVELVPAGAGAIVSAFASPLLGAAAGTLTKAALAALGASKEKSSGEILSA